MKKRERNKHNKYINLILFIILIILIIAIITMGIFSQKPKIVETRTFSELPGFSFEYPVFKGWEIQNIYPDKDSYTIGLSTKSLPGIGKVAAPDIEIKVKNDNNFIGGYNRDPNIPKTKMKVLSNPSGVNYYGVKYLVYPNVSQEFENPDEVVFKISENQVVSISVPDYGGFDRKYFFKKVIETFKFE